MLDANTVAYLDLTGSGAETIAHLRENGRITIMFCAFDGPPRIVRLYGTRRRCVLPGDADFDDARGAASRTIPAPGPSSGSTSTAIATSCGYAVPVMELRRGSDPLLDEWAERKGADGLAEYRAEKNAGEHRRPARRSTRSTATA